MPTPNNVLNFLLESKYTRNTSVEITTINKRQTILVKTNTHKRHTKRCPVCHKKHQDTTAEPNIPHNSEAKTSQACPATSKSGLSEPTAAPAGYAPNKCP